ncbi:MAG TPA: hypothetical protein VI341_09920 [Actinomycetota bacterium]
MGASMVVRVVVGVMAAAIAYLGVQHFLHRGVEIPESIAGVPRLHDAASKEFEEQMKTEAERSDVQAVAGMFGTGKQPEFLVVVVNGSPSESTDELFQSFTGGITEAGAMVGSDKSQGELKDASYRCVAASGNGVQVGTCMWRADDHVGFVLDLDGDIKSAEQLTSQVYRALN